MAFTKPGDAINAYEGKVVLTVNGKNINFAEVQELSAQAQMSMQKIDTIGNRVTGHKPGKIEYTGKLKMFLTDSSFAQQLITYAQKGTYPPITITTTVQDSTSNTGKQVTTISNVIFETGTLFDLQSKDGLMEASTNIVFDAANIITAFS